MEVMPSSTFPNGLGFPGYWFPLDDPKPGLKSIIIPGSLFLLDRCGLWKSSSKVNLTGRFVYSGSKLEYFCDGLIGGRSFR